MEKEKETRECGGRCLKDEDRENWAEGGQVGGYTEGGEGGGHDDTGIKSPIKLHGGSLIHRLMLYCVTNPSQPFASNKMRIRRRREMEMPCVVAAGGNTGCRVEMMCFDVHRGSELQFPHTHPISERS